MTATLKVLTLNAWGIAFPWPIGSPDRRTRIHAIAEALASSDYDIVSLQEIWDVDDFEIIRKRVVDTLPEAHYFYSGVLGSGVCIFTKGDIERTFMHRYSLNGYPHHVHRGDWFGGKVVGLTRIQWNGFMINVFATHVNVLFFLHAEYNRRDDMYLPHRVLQAFELSEFVNLSPLESDVSIVIGDLNFEPEDIGIRMILANSNLRDAYEERLDRSTPEGSIAGGYSCDTSPNYYTYKSLLSERPDGKRIDYILYRPESTVDVVSEKCYTTMSRIPDRNINYSDHDGVCAILKITRNTSKKLDPHTELRMNNLNEGIHILEQGLEKAQAAIKGNLHIIGTLLLLILISYAVELIFAVRTLAFFAITTRMFLAVLTAFYFVYGYVILLNERSALKGAKKAMSLYLRHR